LALIPNLRRYAHVLCRSVGTIDPDDLVQECLARGISKFHLWQRGTNLRAWLFAIMHNLYVNMIQKSIRETHKLSELSPVEFETSTDGQKCEMSEIEEALEKLASDQKSIILLVTLEGLSYQEVAEVLDVPVGTVMSRLSRARQQLKNTLFGSTADNVRYLK